MTPIIPSFHLNAFITFPPTIIAYVLRHYLQQPNGIYEVFHNEALTFAKRYVENNNDIDELKIAMTTDLEVLYFRYFPNSIINVDIVDTICSEDLLVSLTIDISVMISNTLYKINPSIEIDQNNNISIKNF